MTSYGVRPSLGQGSLFPRPLSRSYFWTARSAASDSRREAPYGGARSAPSDSVREALCPGAGRAAACCGSAAAQFFCARTAILLLRAQKALRLRRIAPRLALPARITLRARVLRVLAALPSGSSADSDELRRL